MFWLTVEEGDVYPVTSMATGSSDSWSCCIYSQEANRGQEVERAGLRSFQAHLQRSTSGSEASSPTL